MRWRRATPATLKLEPTPVDRMLVLAEQQLKIAEVLRQELANIRHEWLEAGQDG